jgi:hypothetical protein
MLQQRLPDVYHPGDNDIGDSERDISSSSLSCDDFGSNAGSDDNTTLHGDNSDDVATVS